MLLIFPCGRISIFRVQLAYRNLTGSYIKFLVVSFPSSSAYFTIVFKNMFARLMKVIHAHSGRCAAWNVLINQSAYRGGGGGCEHICGHGEKREQES